MKIEVEHGKKEDKMKYCHRSEIPREDQADFEIWMNDQRNPRYETDQGEEVYDVLHIIEFLDRKGYTLYELFEGDGSSLRKKPSKLEEDDE